MNELQELVAIDTIFSGFGGSIVVVHENEKYEGDASEWVRVSCQTADAKQITMGSNPTYRYPGICFVQIFTPPDSGSGRAMEIAGLVTTLLRGKTISGITFKVPKAVRVGIKDGWYQVNSLTEFYRED